MAPARARHLLLPIVLVSAAIWFLSTGEPRGTVTAWLAEHGVTFSSPSIQPGLEVFDTSGVQPQRGRSLVRGTIRNDTDRRFRVVRIQFELIDGNGDVNGKAGAYLSGLGPGETRAFEANAFGSAFADFRLVEARGW